MSEDNASDTGADLNASDTGADLLVRCLALAGIEILFGVPGDTGVSFYDALYRHQALIRHVLARDERHAAAMADGYARVTNRVGTVEVSSGGGATYVVGGLGESYAASIPVLLIATDIHRNSRQTGALTEIDQKRLFSAVTKWRGIVERADDIPRLVAKAIGQATSGRPGPVALIFPENVMEERVHQPVAQHSANGRKRVAAVPRTRPKADPAAVRAAAEMLGSAQRPAAVVGSGIHISRAYEELERFAHTAGIPVATSIHGKGAMADTDPWSLGVVGANGAREYANAYVREADAVLFVGTRANATDTNSWTGPPRTLATTASIDISPARAGRNFPDGIRLVGDARTVLHQLRESIPAAPSGNRRQQELQERLAQASRSWQPAQPSDEERLTPVARLSPRHLVQVANEVLGGAATVVVDPGTATPNVASYWRSEAAGRDVVIPRGHGAMGYAIPAAIGIAIGRPESTVLAFTADGSFAMSCGELETVSREKLSIIFVQLTNGSLGWIKMLQRLYQGRRYFGVDPGPIDSVTVARACGLNACRVTSLAEFGAVIRAARDNRDALYVDAPILDLDEETPPVAPWLETGDGRLRRPVY